MGRAKKIIERALKKYPPLFATASKLYYAINSSFHTLSPGAPEAIYQALRIAKELNPSSLGDYYEFGLFRGYTLWAAHEACRKLGMIQTHLYGFDSFKGLPQVEGIDQANAGFFESQFACSKAVVVNNLTRHGVDWSRISLIEGFFHESLTGELKQKYPFKRVAVAFIDCDLYSSTKDVLSWLTSLVAEHSVLLFDDWYSFGASPEFGQQKAFREFLEKNPHYVAEPFIEFEDHGKSFILRMT
jgi:O-methyltransferase